MDSDEEDMEVDVVCEARISGIGFGREEGEGSAGMGELEEGDGMGVESRGELQGHGES